MHSRSQATPLLLVKLFLEEGIHSSSQQPLAENIYFTQAKCNIIELLNELKCQHLSSKEGDDVNA